MNLRRPCFAIHLKEEEEKNIQLKLTILLIFPIANQLFSFMSNVNRLRWSLCRINFGKQNVPDEARCCERRM